MLSRQTIFLIVLLIIVGGGAYVTEVRNKPAGDAAQTKPAERVFGTLKISDLKSMEVVQSGVSVTLDRKENGEWVLSKPTAPYTDTTRVSSTVTELLAATKLRSLPLAGVDPHQYGLDTPYVAATLIQANGQQTLLIGGKNVDGSSRYAMLKDAQEAFLLSSGTADALASLAMRPPIATPTVPVTPVPTLPPLPSPAATGSPVP